MRFLFMRLKLCPLLVIKGWGFVIDSTPTIPQQVFGDWYLEVSQNEKS